MGRAQQVEALWNGLRDNSGNPLSGGKVYTYAAGTTTNKAVFTASDKSASATNPLVLDAHGRAQVWADGAYKFRVDTSSDVTLYTLDNQVYGYDDGELLWGGTSGGSANAHTLTSVGTISSYSSGQRFIFIAGNSNTGATTLNVNSIGAVSIVKGASASSLSSGDIRSGQIVDVVYDSGGGGRFRLLSYPSVNDVQLDAMTWGGTAGGTANAQTVTLSPAPSAYVAGMRVRYIPSANNSGATTINVNGLGAKSIFFGGQACVGGEFISGAVVEIQYDGTNFHLVSHAGGWVGYVPSISSLSGSVSSTSVTFAEYQRFGGVVNFAMQINFTPSGSPKVIITQLPVTPTQVGKIGFPCHITDTSIDADVVLGHAFSTTSTNLYVFTRQNANWGSGACAAYISGTYRVA